MKLQISIVLTILYLVTMCMGKPLHMYTRNTTSTIFASDFDEIEALCDDGDFATAPAGMAISGSPDVPHVGSYIEGPAGICLFVNDGVTDEDCICKTICLSNA